MKREGVKNYGYIADTGLALGAWLPGWL